MDVHGNISDKVGNRDSKLNERKSMGREKEFLSLSGDSIFPVISTPDGERVFSLN